ncbi:MAG: PEP-CTERM sorting domain-containing protein [Smithella sp.]
MKYLKSFALVTLLIVCFSSMAMATLAELNDPNDGIEDRLDGSVYAYYQNSGTLLIKMEGNNYQPADFALLQTTLNAMPGFENTQLIETTSILYNSYDGLSGTWNVVPSSNTIDFYLVKGSDGFALYSLDPAASDGSWSTYDLWTSSWYKGKGEGIAISHFTAYNPSTTVPVPTTILLLGSGLWGVLAYGRKRMKA